MRLETLDDVVEDLANKFNIYMSHIEDDNCQCRLCWTMELKRRIRNAIEIDRRLEGMDVL